MQNSSITITKIELAEAIFDQVGLNKREAKEMIDCAKKNNVMVMEAMWARFVPHMIKVREIIASGVLGEIISVQYINRKLKAIEKQYELGIRFSTHSFRKTFGRRIWNRNNNSEKALFMLGQVFNHSSIQTTKIYLGIREQEIANVYLSL